jgi:hypothetical protein
MGEQVELLSSATNYAVVQLPGRRFPGVVIQGDSLHGILQRLAKLRELAITHRDDEELAVGLTNLHALLEGLPGATKRVCQERGIEVPYPAG